MFHKNDNFLYFFFCKNWNIWISLFIEKYMFNSVTYV